MGSEILTFSLELGESKRFGNKENVVFPFWEDRYWNLWLARGLAAVVLAMARVRV